MDFSHNTPPELLEEAEIVNQDLMPTKSKERYMISYQKFMKWQRIKNTKSFSENVLLEYFKHLASTCKPSSLWAIYSMLKSTLNIYNNIDISNYLTLSVFLKKNGSGYQCKKSKTFTAEEVEKYLNEAPDHQNLANKIGLIFGINGACRREELCQIETKDVTEYENSHILVNIPNTKTKIPRSFIITGKFYHKVKQYIALRPQNSLCSRFFLNYQNGKCTQQPIGKQKFGSMPKSIASYLNLPQPELYTGHSFRRTSATLLENSGADLTTIKRRRGWKSGQVAETHIEASIEDKKEMSIQIKNVFHAAVPQGTSTTVNPSISCGRPSGMFFASNKPSSGAQSPNATVNPSNSSGGPSRVFLASNKTPCIAQSSNTTVNPAIACGGISRVFIASNKSPSVAQSSITTVNPSAASGAMPRLFLSTNQTLLTHNTIPQYQTLNLQGTTPAAHLNRVNIIRFVSDQSVGNEVSETEFDCTDFNNWHKYDSQERARLVDRYYKWLTGSSVDEIKKAKNVSNILGFQKLLPKVADHPLLMKRLLCPKNDNDGMFSLLTFMLYMKPPLLKLYNSREKKVRLKLLESVMDHLQIFTDEEVKTLILPEIKLGLQDVDKTIVRATLLCLANLVETLGPQVVIGGASKEWFVNSEDLAEEHEVEIKTEHLDSTNESEFEMEAIVKIEQIDVEEEHINYSNENVSIDINPIKTENDVIKKESNRKKKKPRKSLRRKKVIHYEESESETEDSSFSMDESDEVIESEDETEKKDKKKRSIKKAEDDEETASDEAIVSEDEIERKDKRKRTISNNKDSKEADTEDSDEAIESEDETKREDKRKRKRRKKKDEENKEAPIFIQLVA